MKGIVMTTTAQQPKKYYTPTLADSHTRTIKEKTFIWWLGLGFTLLPCYTNSKYILPGWGQYKKQIKTFEDAKRIIGERGNFAVVCPDGHYVLDFDHVDKYQSLKKDHADIAKSYTEKTPDSGWHVFLCGDVPQGIKLVKGVEVKKVCIVAPSVLPNGAYVRGDGEILSASSNEVFSSLSRPGTPSVYVLGLPHRARRFTRSNDSGKVSQIKAHWNCLSVFGIYKPELQFKIQRGYAVGLCPFHDDHKPSLFIVLDKDFFKCHACGIDGDVINLYARFEGITNAEAIKRMSAVLEMS